MCCCCDACAWPCLSSLRDAGVEGSRTLLAITALHVRDLVSICREAGAVVAMHTLVRDLNVGSVPEMTGGLKS